MAIATLDGVIAGNKAVRTFIKALYGTASAAGVPISQWYIPGVPGPGVADITTSGGVVRSSTAAQVPGQLPHTDPGTGNAYLSRFAALSSNTAGVLQLCDRLWECGNASGATLSSTLTTGQTIASAAWPARDAANSINGDGVLIGVEVSTAMGAGTPTLTLGYTNQAGTAGRSAANVDAVAGSAGVGTFHRFGLQAGDTGVKSVQTFTQSATRTSGQQILVAYRVLAQLELNNQIGNSIDALTGGMPQIPNGAVPFLLFIPGSTTQSSLMGTYQETQG